MCSGWQRPRSHCREIEEGWGNRSGQGEAKAGRLSALIAGSVKRQSHLYYWLQPCTSHLACFHLFFNRMKIFTTPQLQAAVCSHVQKELPVFHEIRNRLSYPTKGWKADILDLTVTMVSQMDTAFLGFPSWTVLIIDKILNKKLCLDVYVC